MNLNKALRLFMIAFVFLMQLCVLVLIAKQNYQTNNFIIALSVLVITFIVILSYKHLDLHHDTHAYEKLTVVVWAPIGALLCYILHVYSNMGSVLSAGIVGTLASFIPSLNSKSKYLKQLPAVIYCGVFVGMSSAEITPSIWVVLCAGTLAGLFLMLSKNLFIGIGGKLGTMAFLGVIIVYAINLIAK